MKKFGYVIAAFAAIAIAAPSIASAETVIVEHHGMHRDHGMHRGYDMHRDHGWHRDHWHHHDRTVIIKHGHHHHDM
jgi:hypothetical protein